MVVRTACRTPYPVSVVLHERDDCLCVEGVSSPVVAPRRSTVGGAHVFHPVEVGSNPWGDRDSPNIPKPPLLLLPVFPKGRAYMKVHGGRAPQCAPLSRAVTNHGGDGAGQQLINSRCPWLAAVAGLFYRPCIPGRVKWWVWRQFFHHIGRVVFWKSTGASSRGVGSMPAARRVDDGAGGRLLFFFVQSPWHPATCPQEGQPIIQLGTLIPGSSVRWGSGRGQWGEGQ